MSSVVELVNRVLTEGQFDTSSSVALGFLNDAHRLMVSRSKCFRRQVQLGPTVAGQMSYPVPPEVQEIRQVSLNGVPLGVGRHQDLAMGALGFVWLWGVLVGAGGGLSVRDENAEGSDLLSLYPTPTESGKTLEAQCICRAAPLEITPTAVTAGNSVTLWWYFATRVLTEAEQATFESAHTLPGGVGYDPVTPKFEYTLPGAATVIATAGITKAAVGVYHATLACPTAGSLSWKGLGYDATPTLVVSTPLERLPIWGSLGVKVPEEFEYALVDMAIATALDRLEGRPDLAAPKEARFAQACDELLKQSNRRFRGTGAAQIRVKGYQL